MRLAPEGARSDMSDDADKPGYVPYGLEAQEADRLNIPKAARDLAYNPQHHERTKHIERRHFWIRELVENGQLVVPLVKTDDNLSDFFTKPLEPTKFISMRNHIMNYEHE